MREGIHRTRRRDVWTPRRLPAVTMWRALLLSAALIVEPVFASCKVCTHKKLYKGRCGALFKKKGSRWSGSWGFGVIIGDQEICTFEESGQSCCASNFDDCCDSDDGAIAGLVIGIIAAIIIGICASRRPRDFR